MLKWLLGSGKKSTSNQANANPKELRIGLVGGEDYLKNFMWAFHDRVFHQDEYASQRMDHNHSVKFNEGMELELYLHAELGDEEYSRVRYYAYPGQKGFILPFIAGTERFIESRFKKLEKLIEEIKYHDPSKPIVVFCLIPSSDYHDFKKPIHTCHKRLTEFCKQKNVTYVGAQNEFLFDQDNMHNLCAIAGGYQYASGSFEDNPPEIIGLPEEDPKPVKNTTPPTSANSTAALQAPQGQGSMFGGPGGAGRSDTTKALPDPRPTNLHGFNRR